MVAVVARGRVEAAATLWAERRAHGERRLGELCGRTLDGHRELHIARRRTALQLELARATVDHQQVAAGQTHHTRLGRGAHVGRGAQARLQRHVGVGAHAARPHVAPEGGWARVLVGISSCCCSVGHEELVVTEGDDCAAPEARGVGLVEQGCGRQRVVAGDGARRADGPQPVATCSLVQVEQRATSQGDEGAVEVGRGQRTLAQEPRGEVRRRGGGGGGGGGSGGGGGGIGVPREQPIGAAAAVMLEEQLRRHRPSRRGGGRPRRRPHRAAIEWHVEGQQAHPRPRPLPRGEGEQRGAGAHVVELEAPHLVCSVEGRPLQQRAGGEQAQLVLGPPADARCAAAPGERGGRGELERGRLGARLVRVRTERSVAAARRRGGGCEEAARVAVAPAAAQVAHAAESLLVGTHARIATDGTAQAPLAHRDHRATIGGQAVQRVGIRLGGGGGGGGGGRGGGGVGGGGGGHSLAWHHMAARVLEQHAGVETDELARRSGPQREAQQLWPLQR